MNRKSDWGETMETSIIYAAKITSEDQGYRVSFRDLSHVFSEGETLQEAILNAKEALEILLAQMAKEDWPIPDPSPLKHGEIAIVVNPEIAVPVLLYHLRKAQRVTMTQVAKSMGVSYQRYQNLESGKNMTLKSLNKVAKALSTMVEIRFHTLRGFNDDQE